MQSIVKALTGPSSGAPTVRLPAFPPHGTTGITAATGTTTLDGPSVTTTKRILQFNDPVFPVWEDLPLPVSQQFAQTYTYRTDCNLSASKPYVDGEVLSGQVQDLFYAISSTGQSATTSRIGIEFVTPGQTAPVTPNWPALSDEDLPGLPFVCVPAGFVFAFCTWLNTPCVAGTESARLKATFIMEEWLAPGQINVVPLESTVSEPTSAGWPTTACMQANYISIGGTSTRFLRLKSVSARVSVAANVVTHSSGAVLMAGMAITSGTISVSLVSADAATYWIDSYASKYIIGNPVSTPATTYPWPVRAFCHPEQLAIAEMWNGVVPHSSHLRLENTTKVLNKEGQLLAGRLFLRTTSPFFTTAASIEPLVEYKRHFGAAEHGLVAYVDPAAGSLRPRFQRYYYDLTDSGSVSVLFVLAVRKEDAFNAIFWTDADLTTIGTVAATFRQEWEFTTVSSIWQPRVTQFTTPDYERAVNMLAQRNPFRTFEAKGRQELSPMGWEPRRTRTRPPKVGPQVPKEGGGRKRKKKGVRPAVDGKPKAGPMRREGKF